LATLKAPLSIRSDKLSEFARMGYVPTAMRCNPYGTGRHSTKFGTWYVASDIAERLIADRHAGRPMPWHGKALAENLRVTYRLWQTRQHPASCKTCATIWGRRGAPKLFDDYAERYPRLDHGAKRHLTLRWTPGLTVAEIARKADCTTSRVRRAITNGALDAREQGGALHATKTDITRWIARGCPVGETQSSWIALTTAGRRYLFTERELRKFIAERRLKSKIGTKGAMRGVVYVPRQQCAKLREQVGFSEKEAARRAGITVSRLREALRGLNWRGTGAIPLVTVQAVVKRLKSRPGYTVKQVAATLGRDVAWVEDRIRDGTVRLLRTTGDTSRLYLSEPMVRRLRSVAAKPQPSAPLGFQWLRLGEAAIEAGVTTSAIANWANQGEVRRVHEPTGWRYHRDAVRARARTYWRNVRFHRATPPEWLRAEIGS
jgi:hypothetical protein